MSNNEAEFREFVGAQMESLRGLAYLTCGDWQVAEDAVLAALARLYVKWGRVDKPDLNVFRAGFEPQRSWDSESVTPIDPIRGRHAFLARSRPMPYDDPAVWTRERVLVWRYADDAVAVLTAYDEHPGLSDAEMIAVASGFAPQATPQPIRQVYSVGWTPPGLRLAAVEYSMRGAGSAVFVPEAAISTFESTARDSETNSILDLPPPSATRFDETAVPAGGMVINYMAGGNHAMGPSPTCRSKDEAGYQQDERISFAMECLVMVEPIPAGDFEGTVGERASPTGQMLTFRAGDDVPVEQLRQAAASARSFGPAHVPGTWRPSVEAFPTSAQLPRD